MGDYVVKGQTTPDMDEADFLAALRAAQSPVSDGEARAVYSYALARGLSPAFLLAMFRHESSFGKAGTAQQSHSWGNTREPSFGVPSLGTVAGRIGSFSRYANWADGGVSTVARFFDHAPYRGKDSVESIIPVWAPPSENSTSTYVAAVLADMSILAASAAPSGAGRTTMPLTLRESLIPAGNSNRPGTKLQGGKPTFITWHETANIKDGANAEMHRRFTHGANGWGGGGHPATATEQEYEGVSFHYTVDDKEAIHLLPDDEIGYHAGDGLGPGSGGATSIGIELCVNRDGDWAKTLANGAQLGALLMAKHGIPLAQNVQHNKWSQKDCPTKLRKAGWAGFVAAIATLTKVTAQTTTTGTAAGNAVIITPFISPSGEACVTLNFRGTVTEILGVAVADCGISAKNAAGETFDRSILSNAGFPWRKRP